jgi:8-oxo-dGTP pyrophosphatase MutT (NUDIX family)
MKFPIPLVDGDAKHEYCTVCFADDVQTVQKEDGVVFYCHVCFQTRPRRIVVGGNMKVWQEKDGELRHESTGVFVREPAGKYLFFELRNYPYGFTVPAGHVDKNEKAMQAAMRELEEEVGIKADKIIELATFDMPGDSCSSGADFHKWHAFVYQLPAMIDITVSEEGRLPQWLNIVEAKGKQLPPVIKYLVATYGDRLASLDGLFV